ncbi:MAG: NAD(P)-dependent oxidoreductase [Chlamydiales bacterium]|nr:NAD(P)-dependent oxidoreductase [Chlamydiales bacterium]
MGINVGFVGLGSMGLPMAQNILKKGNHLSVYNRTREKAAPLLEQGAKWAASPSELAAGCDILVSMVSNDLALKELVEGSSGILSAAKKPSIHISMGTHSPEFVADLEKKHRDLGISFLAAPVSGRPERAREGSLWIFLAGDPKAKTRALPVLEAMSCKVFDLGDKPSQAALFKLCNNFMILSFVESFGEAAAMLEKEGISTEKAVEIWGGSLFNSPIFHAYAPMFCKRSYADAGFALDLGLKDIRLLQTCADRSQVPMPFLSELHEKLIISMTLGREKFDWAAIALLTRELSGLKP